MKTHNDGGTKDSKDKMARFRDVLAMLSGSTRNVDDNQQDKACVYIYIHAYIHTYYHAYEYGWNVDVLFATVQCS
jgi:hypothetical protein